MKQAKLGLGNFPILFMWGSQGLDGRCFAAESKRAIEPKSFRLTKFWLQSPNPQLNPEFC